MTQLTVPPPPDLGPSPLAVPPSETMTPARERLVAEQARFWLVLLAGLIGFVLLFEKVLLPFVFGLAVAYFLDPVVDFFERRGLGRGLATALVLLLFISFAIAALLIALPLAYAQLLAFAREVPGLVDALMVRAQPVLEEVERQLTEDQRRQLQAAAGAHVGDVLRWVGAVLAGLWSGGQALLGLASVMLITPVVAFFLLRDWDRLVAAVDSWLPRDHAPVIREIVRDIDRTLGAWLRGQATVCLILGILLSIGLSLVGLNYAVLIGLFSGFVAFIPYVGMLAGLLLSVGVALAQDVSLALPVALIYLVLQQIEANFVHPRIVGASVGLHDVWIIFALAAGGSLLGFVGVLVAVPVAAVLGVLIRWALRQYLGSHLYAGRSGAQPTEPVPPEALTGPA